jgi:hypothetical protein
MVRRLLILVIVLSLLSPLLLLKKSTKDIPPKYKKWLGEDVLYIIVLPSYPKRKKLSMNFIEEKNFFSRVEKEISLLRSNHELDDIL